MDVLQISQILGGILLWFIFSFALWKVGKTEHEHDDLIGASLLIGVVLVFSIIIGNKIGSLGLAMLLGGLFGPFVVNRVYKISMWDVGDLWGIWLILGGMLFSVYKFEWFLVSGYLLSLIIVLLFKSYYRRFSWYKTGKSGLVFQAFIFLVSLIEVGFAIYVVNGLYFVGIVGIILSIILYIVRVNDSKYLQWTKIQKRKLAIREK